MYRLVMYGWSWAGAETPQCGELVGQVELVFIRHRDGLDELVADFLLRHFEIPLHIADINVEALIVWIEHNMYSLHCF